MKLKDKIALITGASRGIGKATAELFVKEGANVIITSKNKENLEKAASELGINFFVANIQKEKEVQNVVTKTIEKFGRIDVLVNNAGIYPGQIPLHEVNEDDWIKVIDINLHGPFRFTKAAIPHMIKTGGGSIINISSSSGLSASVDIGADSYSASKAALIHLTKIWALEYAQNNIRVNCICPGVVDTDMTKSFMKTLEDKRQVELEHPLKRIGTPQEVAQTILYFASDDSSWVTGSILAIDGGQSAK